MDEGKEGEHCRRRGLVQERQAQEHHQPEVEPICAIVVCQQVIVKVFEGVKGRAVSSFGICKILPDADKRVM